MDPLNGLPPLYWFIWFGSGIPLDGSIGEATGGEFMGMCPEAPLPEFRFPLALEFWFCCMAEKS